MIESVKAGEGAFEEIEMEISHIVISGSGELKERIKTLLTHPAWKLTDSDDRFFDADLIIRVTSGPVETEQKILRAAGGQAKKGAALAVTPSSGITRIASETLAPSRALGLDFAFSPSQGGKVLVQIVKTLETAPEAVQMCKGVFLKASAVAIELQEAPGLILDRVLASVINEAAAMHLSGVADVADIDRVAKSCLNWPAGPFEMADRIGLDKVLDTLEALSREEGPRFLPSRLLRQKVALGHLGRKTGRGFYSYPKGEPDGV